MLLWRMPHWQDITAIIRRADAKPQSSHCDDDDKAKGPPMGRVRVKRTVLPVASTQPCVPFGAFNPPSVARCSFALDQKALQSCNSVAFCFQSVRSLLCGRGKIHMKSARELMDVGRLSVPMFTVFVHMYIDMHIDYNPLTENSHRTTDLRQEEKSVPNSKAFGIIIKHIDLSKASLFLNVKQMQSFPFPGKNVPKLL